MFAKNLEYLLTDCCTQSDLSPGRLAEVAERFDALRGYGMLPRGRDNRARSLNPAQIAAAILGLVPSNPEWAGHAAIILRDLRPVGGAGAAFQGAANLSTAMERLLTESSARQDFLSLTISVAESGTNSNGFSTLTYRRNGDRTQTYFVPKEAVSQLQPGAERSIDVDYFHAPASRFVVFNRTFFDRVARAIEQTAAFPGALMGDGSEYDTEEAEQARYKALGVQNGSRFLNIGVDTQVTWPKKEMLIQFDKYHLVLMPKTKEHTQSIHIDLYANRLTDKQAGTVINRFLSLLAWCDDQFAVKQDGWSGSPVPIAVARRDLAFATAHDWVFDRQIPQSDKARLALALYREGRNAEAAALVSYAVLSYFKVIENQYDNNEDAKARKWITRNFSGATAAHAENPNLKHFIAACGSEAPGKYIWDAYRVAVAHASTNYPSDADDSDEITRLYTASYVLRLLARHMIRNELGVSDSVYSGD